MLEVVRLRLPVVVRGSVLIAGLLLWLAPFQASAAGLEGTGERYHFFVKTPEKINRAESRSPDSTPTFTSALLLTALGPQDFTVLAEGFEADKLKPPATSAESDKPVLAGSTPPATPPSKQWGENAGFQWQSALRQSLLFLGIQHAFRLGTEAGTRADLKGPFFKDYFTTLTKLRGWEDGDPFIVNYIGHPMMGSVTGYIQVQNDPRGIDRELGLNQAYWKSRLRAFGWSFLYSTQFELGLLGEAAIGNIGIRPYDGRKHPMAYVDLVVTPVVGTAWLVGEDALDKYLIRYLDSRVKNRALHAFLRSFLNPTRSMANVLRGKYPWYRDDRGF